MTEADEANGLDPKAMTEADWVGCPGPYLMLEFLQGRISERKLRLFGIACCRRIWHLIADGRSRHAVEVAERHADGLASRHEREQAYGPARVAVEDVPAAGYHAAFAAFWLLSEKAESWEASTEATKALRGALRPHTDEDVVGPERNQQAVLLRDIAGNPFRPPQPPAPSVLHWNGSTVRRLAEAAYEERVMPAGTLDLQRLGVLADALEEAGADDELVRHLRGPGPHVRGCFVVDLILGKS